MYAGRAFLVGLVATAIMSAVILILRAAGLPLDILTKLAAPFGTNARVVGLAIYLVIGGGVALVYAVIFEWVLHQAGIGAGLLLGACNTIIAGFIWAGGSDPGKFWHALGLGGTAALFLLHFTYGAVVGGLYHTKHRLEYW